jgi:Cu/Ag efflux protein CusF
MKRQTWFAALSALALAGTARAQMGGNVGGTDQPDESMRQEQTRKPGETSKAGTFASNQVSGEISHIDKSAKEVTVKSGPQEQTLKMGDNATVFLEGRLGSFEDLKEGQQVRAAYEPREDAKSLRWIEVNPPGGTTTKSESKTGAHDEAHANQITGKVVSIDTATRQVVLDHEGRQWTLDVTNNAPVYIEGRKATLGEIREGQQVRASLDPEKTTKTAIRLETVPTAKAPVKKGGQK